MAGHLETMRLAQALASDDDGGICAVCRSFQYQEQPAARVTIDVSSLN